MDDPHQEKEKSKNEKRFNRQESKSFLWNSVDEDNGEEFVILPGSTRRRRMWQNTFKIIVAILAIYSFLVSIVLMRQSIILLLGKRTLGELFDLIDNPIAGLMVGICATVIIQSPSSSIAIVIGLVSVRKLSNAQAIPVMMGANIGTSVTNTIVSIGQIKEKEQFGRAFSGATVHDMFNILSVVIFLPIEVLTSYLDWISKKITENIIGQDGNTFDSPINFLFEPLTDLIIKVDESRIDDETKDQNMSLLAGGMFINSGIPDFGVGMIVLIFSLFLLIFSLLVVVKGLSSLVQGKSQVWLKKGLNMNGYLAILIGTLVTILVQSSSITTSTLVPLVGLDLITLEAMYPLTLGTNIGVITTIMLAALVTESKNGIQLALAHFIFNISSILVFYPIPLARALPLYLAKTLGDITVQHRWFPVLYIFVVFFILPATVLAISLAGRSVTIGVFTTVAVIVVIMGVLITLKKKKTLLCAQRLGIWKRCCVKSPETQRLLTAEQD